MGIMFGMESESVEAVQAVQAQEAVLEEAVGFSQAQLDDIMALLQDVAKTAVSPADYAQKANVRLQAQGYQIGFDADNAEMNKAGATAGLDDAGGIVLRPPRRLSPGEIEALRLPLSHEGVHQEQRRAAGDAGLEMQQASWRRMAPGGRLDWEKYRTDPHEVAAYARSYVDAGRAKGATRAQVLRQLRTNPSVGQAHGPKRSRFLKYAWYYAQELPEAKPVSLNATQLADSLLETRNAGGTGHRYTAELAGPVTEARDFRAHLVVALLLDEAVDCKDFIMAQDWNVPALFVDAYTEAALWSSSDNQDASLSSNFSASDFAEGLRAQTQADCQKFWDENRSSIEHSPERAGCDFWLSRNGHGTGFFDDEDTFPEAERLQDASRSFGQVDLYVGDDGKIWA